MNRIKNYLKFHILFTNVVFIVSFYIALDVSSQMKILTEDGLSPIPSDILLSIIIR